MRRKASILTGIVLLALLAGCSSEPQPTDAELGLNTQQIQGRRVYQHYCAPCHYAYSSRGNKGPSLKGLYKREYLPSGLLANDQFITQSIVHGRKMMPSTALNQQQLDDLIAYLHTL